VHAYVVDRHTGAIFEPALRRLECRGCESSETMVPVPTNPVESALVEAPPELAEQLIGDSHGLDTVDLRPID